MRGLECTQCQLSFPVGRDGEMQRVWESLDARARERVLRVLRVLAGVIGRVVSVSEQERR